jgi:Txe/YoeB family toxin of toxin-antitoxin system
MNKLWYDTAWADYLYWQAQDRKTLKRVNSLLRDIDRDPFSGVGKPEPLVGELRGVLEQAHRRHEPHRLQGQGRATDYRPMPWALRRQISGWRGELTSRPYRCITVAYDLKIFLSAANRAAA